MTLKKVLSLVLCVCMVLSTMGTVAFADGATIAVAKVGDTEYGTIDEAIANWNNNTTLTLLDDVVLSDAVQLKSTEHHTLDLASYTMTAAEGKNAFEIKACGTGDAERSCITIKADANNPGTLDAGKKAIIYYNYKNGGISVNDRPIIKIEGGIFNAATSTIVFGNNVAGITTIGSKARQCATLNISGGTFNCSIVGNGKSKLLISGGTFNYSVSSQGDSTCYRLISGGTFKSLGFMTADDNNTKFWIGSDMAKSDKGVYIDDNGYLVVGGDVITGNDGRFEAQLTDCTKFSSYLKYSSAYGNGLYFTSVEEAFDELDEKGDIKLFTDFTYEIKTAGNLAIDVTDKNASFGGVINLGNSGHTFTVKTDDESKFNAAIIPYPGYVLDSEPIADGIKYFNSADVEKAVVELFKNSQDARSVNLESVGKFATLQAAIDAIGSDESAYVIKVLKDIELSDTVVIPAGKNITLDLAGNNISMTYATDVTVNHELIKNLGNFTIADSIGEGKISYQYTGADTNFTYATNTITTEPGSVLTVEGGLIENLTTANGIAYALDARTNGGLGDVELNITGGKITSEKIAVRVFANSTTKTGTLNITGGEIVGRVIIHNASAKANKAVLNITGGTFKANAYKTDVLNVGGSNGAALDISPFF